MTRRQLNAALFAGLAGPAQAKRIVLVSGDDEYRSEESLPQLAAILSARHGFACRVLYAIDPSSGAIRPDLHTNIPGLEALDTAALMVLLVRFRDLPDRQMKHIVDYVESGRPIVGLRTATHAFDLTGSPVYARYSWNSKTWDGGFGRQVLGETWIGHHGRHGLQSTRGILARDARNHPVLRGIHDGDIWGPSDVYEVRLPLPGDSLPLVLGQVVEGMHPDDPPAPGPQNHPMLPVAWVKTYRGARVFTTTMGASQDLLSEGLRRLLVNACYWTLGMEDRIPSKTDVRLVGDYRPLPFGFGAYRKGVKPPVEP